jgi:predicted membrane protein
MSSGSLAAIILICAGVLFFLSNLGLVRISTIFQYWPVILIVAGLSRLSQRSGSFGSISGVVLVLLGSLFLLRSLHVFVVSVGMIWPFVLIAVGLLMLSKGWRKGFVAQAGATVSIPTEHADRMLHEWAIFGGVSRVIDTPDFLGGELFSSFGGIEIDLRTAGIMIDKPVVIEANTLFGGISIKVPNHWRVAVRGTGIFGGYQDESLRARQPNLPAPLLIVNGFAMFGGVVVE